MWKFHIWQFLYGIMCEICTFLLWKSRMNYTICEISYNTISYEMTCEIGTFNIWKCPIWNDEIRYTIGFHIQQIHLFNNDVKWGKRDITRNLIGLCFWWTNHIARNTTFPHLMSLVKRYIRMKSYFIWNHHWNIWNISMWEFYMKWFVKLDS